MWWAKKILFMSFYSMIFAFKNHIILKYAPSALYSNFDDDIDYGLWGMYLVAIVMTFFLSRSSHHYLFIFVLIWFGLYAPSFSCRQISSCSRSMLYNSIFRSSRKKKFFLRFSQPSFRMFHVNYRTPYIFSSLRSQDWILWNLWRMQRQY